MQTLKIANARRKLRGAIRRRAKALQQVCAAFDRAWRAHHESRDAARVLLNRNGPIAPGQTLTVPELILKQLAEEKFELPDPYTARSNARELLRLFVQEEAD